MVPTAAAITLAAHAVGILILLHSIFSPLLERDSIAMVSFSNRNLHFVNETQIFSHVCCCFEILLDIKQTHMEPSDIIKTAFPLISVCYFVSLSFILPILIAWTCRQSIMTGDEIHVQCQKHLSLLNNLSLIFLTAIFLHFSFILCGIHPTQLPMHTFISAIYVATTMLLPITLPTPARDVEIIIAASLQHDNYRIKCALVQLKEVTAYLFGPTASLSNEVFTQQKQLHHYQQQLYKRHKVMRMHQCSTLGTLIGMCACTIFRVLDHGMQIQRYPMPIIIGATLGRVFGVSLAIMLNATY
jgi:hypothetical protein